MPKLRVLPKRKVIEILKNNGFKKVRSGKHITFKRKDEGGHILTTWVPHHKEITVFVIEHIIKQTRKSRDEFEI
ncbi:hypothetical protein DRN74_02600 [Candidatus Micrarchaeota archaeon]|nr:MAG: hypothetical protein DRN74_02600 [Candidatus Micrarchaeota archaeon]